MVVSMHFAIPIFISFSQADPAGILFYAQVFDLHHRALEEWCRQSPFGWEAWFASPRWAAPLKQVSCEYLYPVFAGREYTYRLHRQKIANSSCTLVGEITDRDRVCARVESTHVFIDKTTSHSTPIPQEIRPYL